jgi:phosphatidate cytidylyltransferase
VDRDARVRLVVAPLLVLLVVGILWLEDETGAAWPTDLVLALLAAKAGAEVSRLLLGARGRREAALAALASALLVAVPLLFPDPSDAALRAQVRAFLVVALVVGHALRLLGDLSPEASGAVAVALLPPLFVGLPLSFLRELPQGGDAARRLLLVVLVAKASDVGGWIVGRTVGRHRLLPSVSPGKTWEGFAGGLLLSAAAALLLPGPLALSIEGGWGSGARVLFGLLLASASTVAGLLHSAFKRRAGSKDSGHLLPVLGGALDLVDSLLLAAPTAWLWYRIA